MLQSRITATATATGAKARRLCLIIAMIVLAIPFAAEALPLRGESGPPPNPPSAPSTTAATFTVTWQQSNATNVDSSILQERVFGGGWQNISFSYQRTNSVTLTRSPGVYEYRVAEWRDMFWNRYEPDVVRVFSTAIQVNVLGGDPPELDPVDLQISYQYEARIGDVDFNGLKDIYLRRIAGGDPDNGVIAETILRQLSGGTFVVHSATAAALTSAQSWAAATIGIEFADFNLDGYVDLYLRDLPSTQFPGGVPDQMVISSGRPFFGQADDVIAWGDSQAMFSRDVRAYLEDPDYFDGAIEPEEDGYRITIDVYLQVCRNWFGWAFICFPYEYSIPVGDFSLRDLGLDNYLAKSNKQAVYLKSGSSSGSSSSSGVSQAVASKVEQAAATIMSDLGMSNLVGTSAQKLDAEANMTNPSSDPQTLWCVIWCGSQVIFYWEGYDLIYWADRWEPITLPGGGFDEENYSRDAYEFSLSFVRTGKVLKETTEEVIKHERSRELLIKILIGMGLGGAAAEQVLDDIYDPENGVPNGTIRKVLEGMVNAVCAGGISAEECIEAVEDAVLGDGDYDIGSVEAVLEDIFNPGVLGEVNPDVFDEDWMEENIPIYGAKVREHRKKPDRLWCTYYMSNTAGRTYYGRTSTQTNETCDVAVQRRWLAHKLSFRFASYGQSTPDAQGIGLAGYTAIRGREQQLIDFGLETSGLTHLPNSRVANRIRGVAKLNPFGCTYYLASSALHGKIAEYSGLLPTSCP